MTLFDIAEDPVEMSQQEPPRYDWIFPLYQDHLMTDLILVEERQYGEVTVFGMDTWLRKLGAVEGFEGRKFNLVRKWMTAAQQGEAIMKMACMFVDNLCYASFHLPSWMPEFNYVAPILIGPTEMEHIWRLHCQILGEDASRYYDLDSAAWVLKAAMRAGIDPEDIVVEHYMSHQLVLDREVDTELLKFTVTGDYEWGKLAMFLPYVGDVIVSREAWDQKQPWIYIPRHGLWRHLEGGLK